jgi:hypothetical protein
MKHQPDDLIHVIYQHHPRAIPRIHALYDESQEHLRLRAARWRAMLQRLGEVFPECEVIDETSAFESAAGRCCWLLLPQPPSEWVGRGVSDARG